VTTKRTAETPATAALNKKNRSIKSPKASSTLFVNICIIFSDKFPDQSTIRLDQFFRPTTVLVCTRQYHRTSFVLVRHGPVHPTYLMHLHPINPMLPFFHVQWTITRSFHSSAFRNKYRNTFFPCYLCCITQLFGMGRSIKMQSVHYIL